MCVLSVTSAQFPHAELRPQCLLCQLVLPRRTRRANTCGHRTLLAAFFPILLFRQKPRAPAWFSSNRGQTRPRWSTVTPVSSQRRCTAATQLVGGLSCLICCGKMLAALPKNLQKLGREKILDEKAAGAVCSPTWCTRFSAKCGHPLFTVISARALWRDPYFAALCLFSLPPRVPGHPEICFSKQRKIHILQARQICILHHLHAYVAICKFFFGCKDKCAL